jgi:hypothetical protein
LPYSCLVPGPRDVIGYMRAVAPGSPVDRPWSVAGQMLTSIRLGKRQAPKGSPLTLQDVLAREDYRDLMTAKVAEGDLAPDFELPLLDRAGSVHLSSAYENQPVALIFGSYT